MSRILIIEDDRSIAELERDYLEINGFETTICDDGQQGLKEALDGEYDLIILDLMLPGADGFEICRIVREKKNTPIIIVSAKHEDIDKIRGLGLGADDYITKPFSPGEMVARVKAHLNRYERLVGQSRSEVLEIRGLKIDRTSRQVWVNGEEASDADITKLMDIFDIVFYHIILYSTDDLLCNPGITEVCSSHGYGCGPGQDELNSILCA